MPIFIKFNCSIVVVLLLCGTAVVRIKFGEGCHLCATVLTHTFIDDMLIAEHEHDVSVLNTKSIVQQLEVFTE